MSTLSKDKVNSEAGELDSWDYVIDSKRSLFDLRLREIFNYKDLLFLFIKRDIVTVYKQTIFGPVWYFVQPLMTMFTYIIVFGRIAGIATDGIPKPLFYLAGIVLWNLFSQSFKNTADVFFQNAHIYGKVYFPRVIIPIAKVASAFLKFLIQFILFAGLLVYYTIQNPEVQPNAWLLLMPLYLVILVMLGLGLGLFFSALTTKYRDFTFVIQLGLTLMMYATPIIYPMSTIQGTLRKVFELNPVSPLVEAFKYGFIGTGTFDIGWIAYSFIFSSITLLIGILVFNRTEKNFMDTI